MDYYLSGAPARLDPLNHAGHAPELKDRANNGSSFPGHYPLGYLLESFAVAFCKYALNLAPPPPNMEEQSTFFCQLS